MEDVFTAFAVITPIVGIPWLILHYITKWKQAPRITDEDEQLLDELFLFARRLEDRVQTIERIVAADNPDYRTLSAPSQEVLTDAPEYELSRRN